MEREGAHSRRILNAVSENDLLGANDRDAPLADASIAPEIGHWQEYFLSFCRHGNGVVTCILEAGADLAFYNVSRPNLAMFNAR
jgi:hypothetical protein